MKALNFDDDIESRYPWRQYPRSSADWLNAINEHKRLMKLYKRACKQSELPADHIVVSRERLREVLVKCRGFGEHEIVRELFGEASAK